MEVRGLGDSIYDAMLASAQNNVVRNIMATASNGKTSVTVNSKGLTQPSLDSLEEEGVKATEKNSANEILFFWEWQEWRLIMIGTAE